MKLSEFKKDIRRLGVGTWLRTKSYAYLLLAKGSNPREKYALKSQFNIFVLEVYDVKTKEPCGVIEATWEEVESKLENDTLKIIK